MFSLSRLAILISAFFLGFAASAGAIAGVAYYAVNSISINKIEELTNGAVDIPTEAFLGENPEVDLCNMTIIGMAGEAAQLVSLGEALTINLLVDRYDLILNEQFERFLSPETRNLPIGYLLLEEGRQAFLSTIYIGQIQGFECLNSDGTKGSPSEEGTYWYNPKNETVITGLNEILAGFSLGDIIKGDFHTDEILQNVVLADVLGYKRSEDDTFWLDSYGNEVHGIMSVFADCTILTVDEKLKETEIGYLLGYDIKDDKWCELDENGEYVPVHGFMSVVASKTMDTIGGLMNDLTIGDIIPEEDRVGFIGMIDPDTHFNEIAYEVNGIFEDTPMKTFVENGIITFDSQQDKENFMNSEFADCNISQLLKAVSKIPSNLP